MAIEAMDRVKALLRDFEADQLEFRKIARNAKNAEEAKKLMRSHPARTLLSVPAGFFRSPKGFRALPQPRRA